MDQSSPFGSEFYPQADAMGGAGSMASFWPILGILALAIIVSFIAYRIFFD